MPSEEREVRGTVTVTGKTVAVVEMRDVMRVKFDFAEGDLSPASARVLARALYRIARRIDTRAAALAEAHERPDE